MKTLQLQYCPKFIIPEDLVLALAVWFESWKKNSNSLHLIDFIVYWILFQFREVKVNGQVSRVSLSSSRTLQQDRCLPTSVLLMGSIHMSPLGNLKTNAEHFFWQCDLHLQPTTNLNYLKAISIIQRIMWWEIPASTVLWVNLCSVSLVSADVHCYTPRLLLIFPVEAWEKIQ